MAVVVIDALGDAIFLERPPEDELERGQILAEAEAPVQQEAAVVVEESEQERAA